MGTGLARFSFLVVGALALSGCGSTDLSRPCNPLIDPAGEWSVTSTVTQDDCGVLEDPHNWDRVIDFDLHIELDAGVCVINWQEDEVPCDPGFDYLWDTVSFSTAPTSEFTGNDGCTYRSEFRWTELFTEDTMASTEATYTISLVSGSGCTDYAQIPCEVHTSLVGDRCSGCYDGCL